ncbi:hypothetical protein BDR06DRAFT_71650 [Suillus hirtellus]|nr:hypothetical protein BDR06DRAFT_71650 [Suillus hirtellus]
MSRQSLPPTNQLGAGAAEEISLDGMFVNMDTFLNVGTFTSLVRKCSTCSREEWLQRSEVRFLPCLFALSCFCLFLSIQILVHTTSDSLSTKWVLTAVV